MVPAGSCNRARAVPETRLSGWPDGRSGNATLPKQPGHGPAGDTMLAGANLNGGK